MSGVASDAMIEAAAKAMYGEVSGYYRGLASKMIANIRPLIEAELREQIREEVGGDVAREITAAINDYDDSRIGHAFDRGMRYAARIARGGAS